jgi:hypothetical protein
MNRLKSIWRGALALTLCLGAAQAVHAEGRREAGPVFTDSLARGGFVLVETGRAPTIAVDPADAAVVRHAADDLADDIRTVTAQPAGAWESFVIATVEQPLPGVARALVIAGSDRRGTAFGIYELSQAIGVSPWYWWADVAPQRRDSAVCRRRHAPLRAAFGQATAACSSTTRTGACRPGPRKPSSRARRIGPRPMRGCSNCCCA